MGSSKSSVTGTARQIKSPVSSAGPAGRAGLQGVVELLFPRAYGKGLELTSLIHPSVPERLVGDSTRLRQVLINLMGNAVKFTESGEVTLKVRRVGEPEQYLYRFDVIDTGPGISEEDQQAIFQPFQQSTAGLSQGGTGLGLAIVKHLCLALHAEVSLQSAAGEGCTFSVRFPFRD